MSSLEALAQTTTRTAEETAASKETAPPPARQIEAAASMEPSKLVRRNANPQAAARAPRRALPVRRAVARHVPWSTCAAQRARPAPASSRHL